MQKEVIIYHNPMCSKSREALTLLKESGQNITIREYLKEKPSLAEIKHLIQLLEVNPIDIIRKGEDEYKLLIKDKNLSNEQILSILSENPKLIERPIVIKDNKAVIGRPPSLIIDLIK